MAAGMSKTVEGRVTQSWTKSEFCISGRLMAGRKEFSQELKLQL